MMTLILLRFEAGESQDRDPVETIRVWLPLSGAMEGTVWGLRPLRGPGDPGLRQRAAAMLG